MKAQQMWDIYSSEMGICSAYEAWSFGDDPDRLAQLVLAGKKTATASAYDLYEAEGEALPEAGEYSVILDSQENAVCIIRTERVYVVPFRDVDENQAFREGEGDCSLCYWRKVHESFFRQELEAAGLRFCDDIKVVCEEFVLLYP